MKIIYEDKDLLVVDKPAGLQVHDGAGSSGETLVDLVKTRVIDDDLQRPGIVHRLDKDTSGLIIVAKNPDSKAYLQRQFKDHLVKKTYLALVDGHLKQSEAIVKLPVGRHPIQRIKQAVISTGKEAVTYYRVLSQLKGHDLVEVNPQSGRMHQIRVHFAHLGHPIAGDSLYGVKTVGLARQFLHASKLEFVSPSGVAMTFESQLPPDLEEYLSNLEKQL